MQPRYEWQKGKDAWEEFELSGPQPSPAGSTNRSWRLIMAVVLIIGLIGVSVFLFLDRRARRNSAAVEEDIYRTNSLIFRAIETGDEELLRSNMSGRDRRWQLGVESAVASGLLFNRPFWGLELQKTVLDDSQLELVLSPEWNSAELAVPLSYQLDNGGGQVLLEQTLLYRRSLDRWLLAPPGFEFWGNRLLFEGQYLSMTYPERDREIAQRLAADLDDLIEVICRSVEGGGCPVDFQLDIRLYTDSPDFGSLASAVRLPPCNQVNYELPTPTLIGLPLNEGGYEALLAGYHSELAPVALAELIYGTDCPESFLAVAALDFRLNRMGLLDWPLTLEDYLWLTNDHVHLGQVFYYLNGGGFNPDSKRYVGEWRPFYALVEFLAESDETILGRIEANSIDQLSEEFVYWQVLQTWTDSDFRTFKDLETGWEQFLLEKIGGDSAESLAGQKPDWPEQELRLVCSVEKAPEGIAYPSGVLYELDLAGEEWTAVNSLAHPTGYLLSLPGDEGAIVVEQRLDFVSANARVLLWEEGEPEVLFETADNLIPVSFFDFRDRGEQLLVYDRRDQHYGGYLLADCEAVTGCNRTDFGGFPIMSPSGEQFMSLIPLGNHGYEGRFFRPFGVGRLMTLTNALVGKSPFWLSDERLGWVGEDGRTVMALAVAGENYPEAREVLFTLEEVDPLLALDEVVTIASVVSNPKEPEDLIVTVVDRQGWAYIYQVNILRRWIQRLQERAFSLDSEVIYSFDYSPEARWLVASGNDLTTSTAYVHLFDKEQNEVHSFAYKMRFERPMHWTIDWSAGDGWLALPDNGYIRLINPAADYQDVIVPDGVSCSGAVWVNKVD